MVTSIRRRERHEGNEGKTNNRRHVGPYGNAFVCGQEKDSIDEGGGRVRGEPSGIETEQ